MQENKAMKKFRKSKFLANKLDCYAFYNEIYKMLDEDSQEMLDACLWLTLEILKKYSFVTLEEFAECFFKVLKNRIPNVELKEKFKVSYYLLKECYSNLKFYDKLNHSKINYHSENTKGELFLLYMNLYNNIGYRLKSACVVNCDEILESVDEVLANSIDVDDEIDYVNYKLLETAIKYSIRDRLLKEEILFTSDKENKELQNNYLFKYSLVTKIVGINKNNRDIYEVCKKLNISLFDYAKRKISIAMRRKKDSNLR